MIPFIVQLYEFIASPLHCYRYDSHVPCYVITRKIRGQYEETNFGRTLVVFLLILSYLILGIWIDVVLLIFVWIPQGVFQVLIGLIGIICKLTRRSESVPAAVPAPVPVQVPSSSVPEELQPPDYSKIEAV